MSKDLTGEEIKNKFSQLKEIISERKTPETRLVATIIAAIEHFIFDADVHKEINRIADEWGDK